MQVIILIMRKATFIDHFRVEIVQEENSMAFEDYKDLDLKPEKQHRKKLNNLEKIWSIKVS